jgi:hypothetical protein
LALTAASISRRSQPSRLMSIFSKSHPLWRIPHFWRCDMWYKSYTYAV